MRFDLRATGIGVATASLVVLATMTGGTAAQAAADNPVAGECFALTDAQSYSDYWPTTAPVPCSGPHSLEIVRGGLLPADANAFTFASNQCEPVSVWAELGINQPVDGIVTNPIRIDVFPFAVRGGGDVRPAWVCGVGPVEFRGRKGTVLGTMSGAVAKMSPTMRRSLRYCNSAARGRSAFAPPISVPCSTVPRWQVPRWILWSTFYSTYPGEAVLKARAARLCAPATTFSYPTAKDWPTGSKRSFCYVTHS